MARICPGKILVTVTEITFQSLLCKCACDILSYKIKEQFILEILMYYFSIEYLLIYKFPLTDVPLKHKKSAIGE